MNLPAGDDPLTSQNAQFAVTLSGGATVTRDAAADVDELTANVSEMAAAMADALASARKCGETTATWPASLQALRDGARALREAAQRLEQAARALEEAAR